MSREVRNNSYKPPKKIRNTRLDPPATRRHPRSQRKDSITGGSSESGLVVKPVKKPEKVERRSNSLDRAASVFLGDQIGRRVYQKVGDNRLENQSTEESENSIFTD